VGYGTAFTPTITSFNVGLNDVKYLEPIIGKSSRVYEVLNRQRPLTLAMIRRLHQGLGVPPNVLIAETMAG
jgi:HTH-type transcriptional regulator/antitoxin HigA